MKNKKPNAALLWKQLDEDIVPRLGLNLAERMVYAFSCGTAASQATANSALGLFGSLAAFASRKPPLVTLCAVLLPEALSA